MSQYIKGGKVLYFRVHGEPVYAEIPIPSTADAEITAADLARRWEPAHCGSEPRFSIWLANRWHGVHQVVALLEAQPSSDAFQALDDEVSSAVRAGDFEAVDLRARKLVDAARMLHHRRGGEVSVHANSFFYLTGDCRLGIRHATRTNRRSSAGRPVTLTDR